MGILHYLGFDELADSVNELVTGVDELRNEIVASVVGSSEELKKTVGDFTGSIGLHENSSSHDNAGDNSSSPTV